MEILSALAWRSSQLKLCNAAFPAGQHLLARHAAGEMPTGIGHLSGELIEMGPKPGLTPMHPGDVFETSWQGGGGLGDPLDREPSLVAEDVRTR